MRSKSCFAAILAASAAIAAPALAAPAPEPASHPSWGKAGHDGLEIIKSLLVDPASAQIVWTSGFQWGFFKPWIGARSQGWVACGTVNSRNRMGGYAGAEPFFVLVDPAGSVSARLSATGGVSTCDAGTFAPVQSELQGVQPMAAAAPPAPVDVADELAKLAGLRDKGVITPAEFDAQKAKLLAN